MATVRLDSSTISDWNSFHKTCREALGFPGFYGKNMNAWIDCLTYLDEGDGMSRFHLASGEKLNIEISNTESFKSRLPEIFDALVACTASVNRRYIEERKSPTLALIFL
ncbi:MAG TPA: barstar family protein [Blastocatellia bacterium]|nr:barstar family protein [Blastocatellia bacterium]